MALGKLPDEESGEAIFAEINITPLTDIFLVLLIIFMVTSAAMVDTVTSSGMRVNLPKGVNKEVDPGASSLRISIMRSGEIQLQGQKVTLDDLARAFKSNVAKDAQTQIIIEADGAVTHETVVHVMDMAKQAGFSRLAIATKSGGGGGP